MIRYRCPNCGRQVTAEDWEAGRTHRCSGCDSLSGVPQECPPPAGGPAWRGPSAPGQWDNPILASEGDQIPDSSVILWEGRPSLAGYRGNLVIGAFFVLLGLARTQLSDIPPGLGEFTLFLGVIVASYAILDRMCTFYQISGQAVRIRQGIFIRRTIEVAMAAVREVQVIQRPLDRFLDIGNIGFFTVDPRRHNLVFRGVSNPGAVVRLVQGWVVTGFPSMAIRNPLTENEQGLSVEAEAVSTSSVPRRIPIRRIEDYHTHNIGRCSNGDQFMGFVTGSFSLLPVGENPYSGNTRHERAPGPTDPHPDNRWYAVLHRFDCNGRHLHTDAWCGGRTSEGREWAVERAEGKLKQWLEALGPVRFEDVRIGLFCVLIDGILFGLVDDSDPEYGPCITLLPEDLSFYPPWNGEYET